MRVELSGGHHAIIRDVMLRGDRRVASKQFVINYLPDGTRVIPGDCIENVIGALLYKMIIEWDVGQPVPSQAQTQELAQGIIDTLDDRDIDRLRDAVEPFVNRILSNEGKPRVKALEKLAEEYPDRFAELLAQAQAEAAAQSNGAGAAGPKRPVLTSTVISTSSEPEPAGPATPNG